MKTYELLDIYRMNHPEEFFDTTVSLTIFLKEIGYADDDIVKLLSNPITRDCAEMNSRTYSRILELMESKRSFFGRRKK